MPLYLLGPLIRAIPRLQAEEALLALQVAQAGSGNFEPKDTKAIVDGLLEQAGVERPQRKPAGKFALDQLKAGLPRSVKQRVAPAEPAPGD